MERKISSKSLAISSYGICLVFLVFLFSCDDKISETKFGELAPPGEPQKYPVIINHPKGELVVQMGKLDENGKPITLTCVSCHGLNNEILKRNLAPNAKNFHSKLHLKHGSLSCSSCHNPRNPGLFHLSNGKKVSYKAVIQVCAQCHGPQYRDFIKGSHGGMQGYWDKKKGPQKRNHCIDCHRPHQPAFPKFRPAPPPLFLSLGVSK